MARFHEEEPDYEPGLIFNLRAKPEGGGLLDPIQQQPELDPYARREALVLVHGFNNHLQQAQAYYQSFRNRQYGIDDSLLPEQLKALVADLFWPGDADWGIADRLDFLVYPAAVGIAQRTRKIIADHLRSIPNLRKVNFIGHSLGCRVILETIDELSTGSSPEIGRVCLMAAAVPLFKVDEGGSLNTAIRVPEKVLVLYSRSDKVLKWAFRAGQSIASGNEGLWPRALGSRRPPVTLPGNVSSLNISGAGHGNYWRNPKRKTGPILKRFFNIGINDRVVAEEMTISKLQEPSPRPDSTAARRIKHRRGAFGRF